MAFKRSLLVAAVALVVGSMLFAVGCGGDAGADQTGPRTVVQETGSIDTSDTRDPNHSDLPYDAYTFEADRLDNVRVEVVTDDFSPLLKLVEVSTGAPLWEWDAAYSDEDALLYTIAATGTYEARVYAMDGGAGAYEVRIILSD